MGIGETGVGEMGVGETGPNRILFKRRMYDVRMAFLLRTLL